LIEDGAAIGSDPAAVQAGFTEAAHIFILEGALMAVIERQRTVIAEYGAKEPAETAIAEIWKRGTPPERISVEEMSAGRTTVSVTATSQSEAEEISDVLDRYNLPDLSRVPGQQPGAERLSADEKLRQGDVADHGDSMQASRRTRIITE
jgi:hypothetical protein